jgi:hypothetical protein
MRRWLRRFAGLRPWRRRRPDLDLVARCEVLRLRGELDDQRFGDLRLGDCGEPTGSPPGRGLGVRLPGLSSASLALVSEEGDRVPVRLEP